MPDYFVPKLGLDHEVAEVWDRSQRCWRLIDAELSDEHVDPTDGAVINPLDVPRDRFLVAGQAWELFRTGKADPQTFMVDPGLDVEATRGWPYLQHNLVHDLAALTKIELLLWDAWCLADQPASGRDLDLLDRLAKLTSSPEPVLGELRELTAADPRLPVPRTVTSYDPLGGPQGDTWARAAGVPRNSRPGVEGVRYVVAIGKVLLKEAFDDGRSKGWCLTAVG